MIQKSTPNSKTVPKKYLKTKKVPIKLKTNEKLPKYKKS